MTIDIYMGFSCSHSKPTVYGCYREHLQCRFVTFHLTPDQRLVCDRSILCFNCIHQSNCADIQFVILSNIWKAGVLV